MSELQIIPHIHMPRLGRGRSLVFRLTLAFLCVGLIGALLVAFFVGQRTQQAFNQFVDDRSREALVTSLGNYYQTHASWAGAETVIAASRPADHADDPKPPVIIIGTDGRVAISDGRTPVGTLVSAEIMKQTPSISVNGKVVGYLIDRGGFRQNGPGSPEGAFRDRVYQALAYGALGAMIVALLLGLLLARTLTRPLRELTMATQALAQGGLGQQVTVRSRDELGVLAQSFNRMSADLAHASTLRRQMTADIAHDLRTPLSVILGYTEALREGKLPPSEDIFATMHGEAQHLQRLIDDLRTLSLADAGELPLARQEVEPHELIERAAASYSAQAAERQIILKTEIAPNLPLVNVDAERIAQVLGNLLVNALRYTPPGGTITLAAQQQGQVVQLKVGDTGSGISAEALPHVFERFYRADTARQHEGSSGLGLSIVRSIIEAHGGTVSVDSTPGAGTTFTIQLAQPA